MKRLIFFEILMSLGILGVCQVPSVIPPSPEASSLLKNIETPMNYHSGLPNISIPIFEAISGNIKVPISLSYNASGIRVEEIASRSGLGWQLSAGGRITRNVRGIADDTQFGWINTNHKIDELKQLHEDLSNDPDGHSTRNTLISRIDAASNRHGDYEPDIFNIIAPGVSGKFILDQDDGVINIPQSELDISYSDNFNGIQMIKVVNASGYEYFFGSYEGINAMDSVAFTASYTSSSSPSGIPDESDQEYFSNSWHLMKILSPYGEGDVTFNYTTINTINLQRAGERKTFYQCGEDNPRIEATYMLSENFEKVISSIEAENGTVEFIYSNNERLDNVGDHALESIIIRNIANKIIKKVDLVQDYWLSNDAAGIVSPIPNFNAQYLTYRMYLDSVKVWNSNESEFLPYTFEYNPISLPNRLSNSQDVWGYYNAVGNDTFLPTHFYSNGVYPDQEDEYIVHTNQAYRRAIPEKGIAKTLTKIHLPTGGTKEFVLEPHGVYLAEQDRHFENTYFALNRIPKVNYWYYDGDPLTFEQTITIGPDDFDGILRFSYNVEGCGGEGDTGEPGGIEYCGIEVKLEGISATYTRSLSLQNDAYFRVAPGTYKLVVNVVGYASTTVSSAFALLESFENPNPYHDPYPWGQQFSIGGFRVAEIIDNDNQGSVKKTIFRYRGGRTDSKWNFLGTFVCDDALIPGYANGFALIQSSYSQVPSIGAGIGSVRYKQVEVIESTDDVTLPKTLGLTRHEYTELLYQGEQNAENWPHAPYETYEWTGGNLFKSSIFEEHGSSTTIKRVNTTDYDFQVAETDSLFGYVDAAKVENLNGLRAYEFYKVFTGATHVNKQTEEVYEKDNILEEIIIYDYDSSYFRPRRQAELTSQGDTIFTSMYYNDDFSLIEGLNQNEKNVLEDMSLKNIHDKIVFQKKHNSSNEILSKQLSVYDTLDNKYLLRELREWNRYKNVFFTKTKINYTDFYKPAEIINSDGSVISYLWGYNNKLPVVKAIGSESIDFENLVNGSNFNEVYISDQSLIDELTPLISQLPNSQITIYSHKPGYGISSITDQNGRSSFYEYDYFGRLFQIKDHERNLLKKYEYNYKR